MKSISRNLLLLLAISVDAAATTNTAAKSAVVQTSIPFVQYGGIRDWKSDRDQGLWVQDIHRRWHYAKFMGHCPGLAFATTIAFDTRPIGTFDRFSSVLVSYGTRCALQSVTASEGPPRKKKTPVSSTAHIDAT
jgi:hypothetical protein